MLYSSNDKRMRSKGSSNSSDGSKKYSKQDSKQPSSHPSKVGRLEGLLRNQFRPLLSRVSLIRNGNDSRISQQSTERININYDDDKSPLLADLQRLPLRKAQSLVSLSDDDENKLINRVQTMLGVLKELRKALHDVGNAAEGQSSDMLNKAQDVLSKAYSEMTEKYDLLTSDNHPITPKDIDDVSKMIDGFYNTIQGILSEKSRKPVPSTNFRQRSSSDASSAGVEDLPLGSADMDDKGSFFDDNYVSTKLYDEDTINPDNNPDNNPGNYSADVSETMSYNFPYYVPEDDKNSIFNLSRKGENHVKDIVSFDNYVHRCVDSEKIEFKGALKGNHFVYDAESKKHVNYNKLSQHHEIGKRYREANKKIGDIEVRENAAVISEIQTDGSVHRTLAIETKKENDRNHEKGCKVVIASENNKAKMIFKRWDPESDNILPAIKIGGKQIPFCDPQQNKTGLDEFKKAFREYFPNEIVYLTVNDIDFKIELPNRSQTGLKSMFSRSGSELSSKHSFLVSEVSEDGQETQVSESKLVAEVLKSMSEKEEPSKNETQKPKKRNIIDARVMQRKSTEDERQYLIDKTFQEAMLPEANREVQEEVAKWMDSWNNFGGQNISDAMKRSSTFQHIPGYYPSSSDSNKSNGATPSFSRGRKQDVTNKSSSSNKPSSSHGRGGH